MSDAVLHSRNQVTALTGIAYSLPVVPILILMSTNNVLSGIYATYHGLTLASISMVMLVAGLFDAVTDPSIGYLSDRYHARTGSRKPFIVAGAILLIPCAWFLLNPADGVTITYFLVWYLLFYLAMTMFQIPHLTWGGEISSVGEEKTKVYGYRNYAGYAGMILFVLVPIVSPSEGTKVTPETMRTLVIVAGIILLPTLYMMLRYVPKGVHRVDQARKPENPVRAIQALTHNKPFLVFFTASILSSFALAFYTGLNFMMMDAYLGLGDYYVYLLLFHLTVAIIAIKPAVKLITRIGKAKAWMIAVGLMVISFSALPFVFLKGFYSLSLLILFNMLFAFSSAISNVAIYSLLSDISDYSTLKTGIDRSATFFALKSLSIKTCMAIGISLSLGLAALLGFDPAATSQGDDVYWVLTLCMGVIPILLSLIAALCIPKIAITARRHAIIRKRLDARAVRAEAALI